jgi:membrane protease subunit HflC
MNRLPIPSLIVATVVVAVLVVYAVTFQVRFSQVAVRVLLGKADESSVVREPGLYLRWPWPIESIVRYDKRYRVLDTPESEIKTKDGKNIIVGCFTVWRIARPLDFKIAVETERRAEGFLRARINETRSAIIGKTEMARFVSLDASELEESHAEIERQMLDLAAKPILDEWGIELKRIGIRRVSLPEEVSKKVFESMIQERQALAARYREEGTAEAETIKAEAESAKNQILAFARRKGQEIESAGVRAATKTLEQINAEDKDFFIWLRYLEALQASLQHRTTIFFDTNHELFRGFAQPPLEVGAALPRVGPPAESSGEATDQE